MRVIKAAISASKIVLNRLSPFTSPTGVPPKESPVLPEMSITKTTSGLAP
ncbi:MAG: hypothetical protein IGS39_11920 [Calothrix sp. C42_A2020_038]|nr:hypothetical protein [Calothrix sp. C42_A2020_038]